MRSVFRSVRMGRWLVAVLAAAVVAGGSAFAAVVPRPLDYVLRPPDFPANADPVDAGPMPASFAAKLEGIRAVGKGARYFASIPFGPERFQTVSGLVVTTPSAAEARKVYAWQKRTAMRLPRGAAKLRLARLGDQQAAFTEGRTDAGRLLVRRNRIVWRLEIAADGMLQLSPARLRDELAKYGEKEQGLVGKG